MKKSFLIVGIIFIVIGIVFLYLHFTLAPSSFQKGLIPLKSGEGFSLSVKYHHFVLEYKDNISKPLLVIPENAEIINSSYKNGTYYLFGVSFYDSHIIFKDNYSEGVLVGFVILDDSPTLLLYSLSLMFFVVMIIVGSVIIGLSFMFKGSDTEGG